MRFFLSSLFFFILLAFSAGANDRYLDVISRMAAPSIQNGDRELLRLVLSPYLAQNREIKALEIRDVDTHDVMLGYFLDSRQGVYDQPLPETYLTLESFERKIIHADKPVGILTLYVQRFDNTIGLSVEEVGWLKAHPVIRMGSDPAYPPFEFMDKNHRYVGIAAEYLKIISRMLGVEFRHVNGLSWSEALKGVQDGTVDILPVITNTQERRKFLNFTNAYLDFPSAIVMRSDSPPLKGLEEFAQKSVAISRGYSEMETLPLRYPDINIQSVSTPLEALQSVAAGKVETTYGNLAVLNYLMQEHSLLNLKIAALDDESPSAHAMGVRKDWPEFVPILQKALDSMTRDERNTIRSRWLGTQTRTAQKSIDLTREELQWIRTHTVRVGVEQWSPTVFSNTGKDIDGIAGDVLKLVVQNTGLKIEIVNDLWNTLLDGLKNETIDLLPATYYTDKRAAYGLYSKPYFKMADYIYVKEENTDIRDIYDLKGKRLAIIKGYGTIDKLEEKFPEIELVFTKDLSDSISRVLRGEVDAFYEGQVTAEYKFQEDLITGIKGVPQSAFKAPGLCFFSRKELPILHSILQKGLESIPQSQINQIKSKWLAQNTRQSIVIQQERPEITYLGLFSVEEMAFVIFIITLLGFVSYYYLFRSHQVLSVSFRIFNIFIIVFELAVISFMIYEVARLDRIENALATAHKERLLMMQAADSLRQSSDDLTHFARSYAATKDDRFEKHYHDTLAIRNGEIPRPVGYDGIYWDLNRLVRNQKHPAGEKQALRSIIDALPFTNAESAKLLESEDNSNALVTIEKRAFTEVKLGNQERAIELLYSAEYYKAKHNIMLPIDEMITLLTERTSLNISKLEVGVGKQYTYILVVGLLFILGNIFIYILLRKKVNTPISYLSETIEKIKRDDPDIIRKSFYDDEVGRTIEQFFLMQDELADRENVLKHLLNENEKQKEFVQTLLNSLEQIVITTDGKTLQGVNSAFLTFFGLENQAQFPHRCICDTFDDHSPDGFLQPMIAGEKWVDYVLHHPNNNLKAQILRDGKKYVFSVSVAKLPTENLYSAVFTDITEIEEARSEIEELHGSVKESIDFASMIQCALLPDQVTFYNTFSSDTFFIWQPRDVVGGDVFSFEILRHEDEYLVSVIDCTGHGVPGAFVTMIFKTIEKSIISDIMTGTEDIHPSEILQKFNREIKTLLKQDTPDSLSNAGLDAGLLYIDKRRKLVRFAGAEIPLFYIEGEGLKVIKGDRHSVGYRSSDADFVFKEHEIPLNETTSFYLTTDGYLDQNGGAKGFPLGKKRFGKILEEYNEHTMVDIKEVLVEELHEWQGDEERNDDVTVIGVRL